MKALLLLSVTALFCAGAIGADNEVMITQEKLFNIPIGNFWVDYDVQNQKVSSSLIRTELTGNFCGPTSVAAVSYINKENGNWIGAKKNSKGLWMVEGDQIRRINVLINQPKVKWADCTLRMYVSTLVGSSSEETFIGVIEYQGGYDPNLTLPIYPARMVKSFRIAIPEFCTGVQILESGVSIEGIFEKSKIMDKGTNTYSVNDGHGLVVSGISMKINGPDKACTIPMFIKE